MASSVRIGRSMVHKTPLWSKKKVERVIVFLIWSARCRESQMVRWSMHLAKLGWCGGAKVEFSVPSHLKNARDCTWASFDVEHVLPP